MPFRGKEPEPCTYPIHHGLVKKACTPSDDLDKAVMI